MYQDIAGLAAAYYREPSNKTRESLVLGCMPLIRSIVSKLRIPPRLLTTFEDLQGVGLLGLMEAIDRFDPEMGTRFTSFAYQRIRGAVIDYLRAIDAVPRERREAITRMQHAMDALSQQQGEAPSEREVADFLGISLYEYHTLLQDAQFRHTLSLQGTTSPNDEGRTLYEAIPDRQARQRFMQIEWDSESDFIQDLVCNLPERKQQILSYYYEDGLTLREIGELYSVSESRVSQLLSETLRYLRGCLAEAHLMAA